jgi:multisubunit Na+/H+ antiporter MnhE subunit
MIRDAILAYLGRADVPIIRGNVHVIRVSLGTALPITDYFFAIMVNLRRDLFALGIRVLTGSVRT